MTAPADETGFVQVACPACSAPDVWLKCDTCKRRSHFVLQPEGVACACGARYSHAVCVCKNQVPLDNLRLVPFEKGPVSMDDLEIDWRKVAVLSAAAAGVVGSGLWLMLG